MLLAEHLLQRFQGREDVYAWEPKGGTFAPVQKPLSLAAILAHLEAEGSAGFYLLRKDSTVNVAAFDFDNHDNKNPLAIQQAQLMCKAFEDCGWKPLLEISSGGQGAHVWAFFEKPEKAFEVRRVFKGFLRFADLPVSTEIYPRQDSLNTEGGLGNLLRVPLSGQSRFVDPANLQTLSPEAALKAIVPVTGEQLVERLDHFEIYEESSPVIDYKKYTVEGLPPRVHQLLESDGSSMLVKRWHKDTTGLREGSMSSVAASLALQLVRQMVPTPEIEAALLYWANIHNYAQGQKLKWVQRTVASAYSCVGHIKDRREISGRTIEGIILEAAKHFYENDEVVITTGMEKLDASIGGLTTQELTVLAARPSNGKTLVAQQWLSHVADCGYPCLFVSLEMGAKEIGKRYLLQLTPNEADWKTAEGLAHTQQQVAQVYRNKAQMYFVDSDRHIDKIEETIGNFAVHHGVKFVVVDYQGLIKWRGTQYEQQTEIVKRLKEIAKRHDVCVVTLVQLKRPQEVAKQKNFWTPSPDALRDSGEIEQTADVIVGLQWPSYEKLTVPKHMEAQFGKGDFAANDYFVYPLKCRNRGIREPFIPMNFYPHKQSFGPWKRQDAVQGTHF